MGQLLECGACGMVMFALLTAVRLRNSVRGEDDGSGDSPPEAMCRVEMGIRQAGVAIGRCCDTLARNWVPNDEMATRAGLIRDGEGAMGAGNVYAIRVTRQCKCWGCIGCTGRWFGPDGGLAGFA